MYQLLLSFDKLAGPSMPRTGGPESTKTVISWKLNGVKNVNLWIHGLFVVVKYGPYKLLDQLSGLSRSTPDGPESPNVII